MDSLRRRNILSEIGKHPLRIIAMGKFIQEDYSLIQTEYLLVILMVLCIT